MHGHPPTLTHLFAHKPTFVKINQKEPPSFIDHEDNHPFSEVSEHPNPYLSKGCILVPYNARVFKNYEAESTPRNIK